MSTKLFYAAAVCALMGAAGAATAEERGGTLRLAVSSQPDTFDCNATTNWLTLHHLAQHYSTLLRISTSDYPALEGNLAKDWQVSQDGLTYTFTLNEGIKFHDGTPLTSKDVKATYERMKSPPPGPAPRKGLLSAIETIDAPDPQTVVFTLSRPDSSLLAGVFANPWGCVLSADLLASDPDYPTKKIMGSGPFTLAEFRRDEIWQSDRFQDYFKPDKPKLDHITLYPMARAAQINALLGGQIDGELRGMSREEAEGLAERAPDKFTLEDIDGVTEFLLAFNNQSPELQDPRVRRALSIAFDRQQMSEELSQFAMIRAFGGLQRPGTEFAATGADLDALPGFGVPIETARDEAKALLAEAGVKDLSLKLIYAQTNPYEQIAVYLNDQLRQIGVDVQLTPLADTQYFAALGSGEYQMAVVFSSFHVDNPVLQLSRFASFSKTTANVARYEDAAVDAAYEALKATSDPVEQARYVREIEKRVLAEQAYYAEVGWQSRTAVIGKDLQGFTLLPSQFLNLDMENIWVRK